MKDDILIVFSFLYCSKGLICILDGSIIWQQFIPDMAAFITNGKTVLYMQRSVAHFPLVPQYVVVGRSRSGQGSVVFTFNPSTGKSIDPDMPHGETLPYNILQTMLLPYHGKYVKIFKGRKSFSRLHGCM